MRESGSTTLAKFFFSSAACALAAGACQTQDVASIDPETEREQRDEITIDVQRDLDLVFVIDESLAMQAVQDQLGENFPRFMEELESIEGGLPDINIGVVSVDMGADPTPDEPYVDPRCTGDGKDGRFLLGEGDQCEDLVDGRWLEGRRNAQGEVEFNFDEGEDLQSVFSCMAALGADGCGFEMPLKALNRAIDRDDQSDFFRDDAHLAVVIVTMEDDCSAEDVGMFGDDYAIQLDESYGPLASFRCTDYGIRCDDDVECDLPSNMRCEGDRQNCEPNYDSPYMDPPEDYADALKELHGGDTQIIIGGIWGDGGPVQVRHEEQEVDGELITYARSLPTCELPPGADAPEFPDERDVYPPNAPIRLQTFMNQFSETEEATICDDDLVGPVQRIGQRIAGAVGSPCVSGSIQDTEPEQDGIQPECSIADVRNFDTENEEIIPIPECDGSGSDIPCWEMEPSPTCDGTESGLELQIDRGGDGPPPNTRLDIRCLAG